MKLLVFFPETGYRWSKHTQFKTMYANELQE